MTDPGAQASLYDVLVGARQAAIEQLRDALQGMRDPGVTHLATLLLVSTQVTNQMRHLALAPQVANELGVASQLALARAKEGIWVRTAALLDFLDMGNRHYLVGIIAPKVPLPKRVRVCPPALVGSSHTPPRPRDARPTAPPGSRNEQRKHCAVGA